MHEITHTEAWLRASCPKEIIVAMGYADIPDYTLFTLEEAAKILACSTENVVDLIMQGLFKTARQDDEIYLLGFALPYNREIIFAIKQSELLPASLELPARSKLPSFNIDLF